MDLASLAHLNIEPHEAEAIRLLAAKESVDVEMLTTEQVEVYLTRIRERASLIEGETQEMLMSRVREGRRYPRRQQRFAVAAWLMLGLIGSLAYLAYEMLR